MSSLLHKLLGLKSPLEEQEEHREQLKRALKRQAIASRKAEATLINLLSRVSEVNSNGKD